MTNEFKFMELDYGGPAVWTEGARYFSKEDVISNYFNWILDGSNFRFCLIVPCARLFRNIRPAPAFAALPKVCSGETNFIQQIGEFKKLCHRGYSLILATSVGIDTQAEHFIERGFGATDSKISTIADASLAQHAWNKDMMVVAMESAILLGAGSFCCFGHDADPVYLFSALC